MKKIKIFSKSEKIALGVIFLILIAVAIPNFIASLRRARDQVRRDDMGTLFHALLEYDSQFGVFPNSSDNGEIMDCLKAGDKPCKNEKDLWVINAIPCRWGVDSLSNLITAEKYIDVLPRDPKYKDGDKYVYQSDGASFQLFGRMEGTDEAEVDQKIIDLGIDCGGKVCNIGRSYNCDLPKTIKECEAESLLKK